jgi:predicted outer membrane repeat protein
MMVRSRYVQLLAPRTIVLWILALCRFVIGSAAFMAVSRIQRHHSRTCLYKENLTDNLPRRVGEAALEQVQSLGQGLTDSERQLQSIQYFGKRSTGIRSIFAMADSMEIERTAEYDLSNRVTGLGGAIYSTNQKELKLQNKVKEKEEQVWQALTNLEADSTFVNSAQNLSFVFESLLLSDCCLFRHC